MSLFKRLGKFLRKTSILGILPGEMFKGKEKEELPSLPLPSPSPTRIEEGEEAMQRRDWPSKLARRRKGYESTILAGLLTPYPTGRRTKLG